MTTRLAAYTFCGVEPIVGTLVTEGREGLLGGLWFLVSFLLFMLWFGYRVEKESQKRKPSSETAGGPLFFDQPPGRRVTNR